jgi:heptosyltransferase-2
MAAQLRPHRFERVVLFSEHRWRTVMPFLLAGVRLRIGYGTQWLQRRLLTRTAWIQRYQGSAVAAYKDATAFCMTHGWCREPIVPRLSVREDAEAEMRNLLVELPRPCHALAIGASESYKQWGEACFGELANALCGKGHSVLLLGGPTEHSLATAILNRIEPRWRDRVLVMTENTVSQTVAALSLVQSCIGNDTGAANIAAAVGTPTWVVLGPRPPLEHDPITLHLLRAPRLQDIHPAEVAEQVLAALSE